MLVVSIENPQKKDLFQAKTMLLLFLPLGGVSSGHRYFVEEIWPAAKRRSTHYMYFF